MKTKMKSEDVEQFAEEMSGMEIAAGCAFPIKKEEPVNQGWSNVFHPTSSSSLDQFHHHHKTSPSSSSIKGSGMAQVLCKEVEWMWLPTRGGGRWDNRKAEAADRPLKLLLSTKLGRSRWDGPFVGEFVCTLVIGEEPQETHKNKRQEVMIVFPLASRVESQGSMLVIHVEERSLDTTPGLQKVHLTFLSAGEATAAMDRLESLKAQQDLLVVHFNAEEAGGGQDFR